MTLSRIFQRVRLARILGVARLGGLCRERRLRARDPLRDLGVASDFGSAFAGTPDGAATAQVAPIEGGLPVPAGVRDTIHHNLTLYRKTYALGPEIDWQRDPESGIRFGPQMREDLGAGQGDIKKVWQLSCGHYLLDLALAYVASRDADLADCVIADISAWIDRNESEDGVNWWSPTEASLRMAIWTLALYLCRDHVERRPAEDQKTLLDSLVRHLRFVAGHLEHGSVRTNHYTANLSSLYAVSCLLGGLPGVERVRLFARDELEEEIRAQTGADGVQFEFSAHYHRFVTELFCVPFGLARMCGNSDFSNAYGTRLSKMLTALEMLANTAGVLPQIGDNDSEVLYCIGLHNETEPRDIRPFLHGARTLLRDDAATLSVPQTVMLLTGASPPEERALHACRPAESPRWVELQSCGWYVYKDMPLELVAVAGKVGTRGLGVHDHCHAAELLVSAGGVEFIVDAGTGCYTADPDVRNRLRSARAHSCPYVGREPGSWKEGTHGLFYFRGIWRSRARVVRPETLRMSCRFQRFRLLREITVTRDCVVVRDCLNRTADDAWLQWVLHPAVEIVEQFDNGFLLARNARRLRLTAEGGEWRVTDVPYSEHFGHLGVTRALRLMHPPRQTMTRISVP
jgi:hypothetical protein